MKKLHRKEALVISVVFPLHVDDSRIAVSSSPSTIITTVLKKESSETSDRKRNGGNQHSSGTGCNEFDAHHDLRDNNNNNLTRKLAALYCWESNIIWRGLLPCLYSSPKSEAKRALQYLLNNHQPLAFSRCSQEEHQQQQQQLHSTTTIEASKEVQKSLTSKTTKASTTTETSTKKRSSSSLSSSSTKTTTTTQIKKSKKRYIQRSFQFAAPSSNSSDRATSNIITTATSPTDDGTKQNRIIVWLEPLPPSPVLLSSSYMTSWSNNNKNDDFYFCKLLVRWEHEMIKYQSMAAWCATLGGGYYYCRHFKTAIQLAKKQYQYAILMGDTIMAAKCYLNEAYGYIYSGKFKTAMNIIHSILNGKVLRSAAPHHHNNSNSDINNNNDQLTTAKTATKNNEVGITAVDPSIIQMCYSAKLFCLRMKKVSVKLQQQQQKAKQKLSAVVDDYQRIRIVQE